MHLLTPMQARVSEQSDPLQAFSFGKFDKACGQQSVRRTNAKRGFPGVGQGCAGGRGQDQRNSGLCITFNNCCGRVRSKMTNHSIHLRVDEMPRRRTAAFSARAVIKIEMARAAYMGEQVTGQIHAAQETARVQCGADVERRADSQAHHDKATSAKREGRNASMTDL